LNLSGQNGAFNNYSYVAGTDYALTSGVIDFGIGGTQPTLGIPFNVEYTYSELGSATASTSMWIASTTVHQELASTFPYNQTSPSGVAYNDLATLGTLMVAARECCVGLAASDNVNAVKYRRGAIQMDETAKTKGWTELAKSWSAKYDKYLAMIRPSGRPSSVMLIAANAYNLVLPTIGADCFPEMSYLGSYGGVL
jgi:hypothetical protein